MNKRSPIKEVLFLAYLVINSFLLYGSNQDGSYMIYLQIMFPVGSLLLYNVYVKNSHKDDTSIVFEETAKTVGNIVVFIALPALAITALHTIAAPVLYLASAFREKGVSAELSFLISCVSLIAILAIIGLLYQRFKEKIN